MDGLSDAPATEPADDAYSDAIEEVEPNFEIVEEPDLEEYEPEIVEEDFEPEIVEEPDFEEYEPEISEEEIEPEIVKESEFEGFEPEIVEEDFQPDIVENGLESGFAEVEFEQASDANDAPDNLDLPDEAHPSSGSTEIGNTGRAERKGDKPEVEDFDLEGRQIKMPEGWRPGGLERGG